MITILSWNVNKISNQNQVKVFVVYCKLMLEGTNRMEYANKFQGIGSGSLTLINARIGLEWNPNVVHSKCFLSSTDQYVLFNRSLKLANDYVFGNYVIQKFFEHGDAAQIRERAEQLTGHVLTMVLGFHKVLGVCIILECSKDVKRQRFSTAGVGLWASVVDELYPELLPVLLAADLCIKVWILVNWWSAGIGSLDPRTSS
ncbi:hypothetical protein L1987_15725 [Smallanthus sonchifolius]|uniref:Uncharacterized protein n=1 Tax=Smallanthus sonchifolius TaxID=185202 RepID=A0ACB9J8H2_9ASTR|nr:hypothetical protein L1987_15725 [Smallanthus sonchifolius]